MDFKETWRKSGVCIFGIFLFLWLGEAAAPAQDSFLDPYPNGKKIAGDIMPAEPPPQKSRALDFSSATVLPVVRIGYLVPSNRMANPKAVENLRSVVVRAQSYFRTQMAELGFGPKTFSFETESDGVTPVVHTVYVSKTDEEIRDDIWSATCNAASDAGLSIWSAGEVWLLVPEAHIQNADASISGGTSLGAGSAGTGGGVAIMGSDSLVMFDPAYAADDRAYAGMTLSALGPYPLVANTSFVWFEGSTLSAVSSSKCGAVIHEMTHAFGIPHDFRHDSNFNGDLMGNGLRGLRGVFNPGRYTAEYCRVSVGCGLTLNTSRYFNHSNAGGNYPTSVNVSTVGTVLPVEGKMPIAFTASDRDGLAVAWLQRNGDLVAEMPLSGTSVDTSFSTAYFTPGTAESYTVTVYDVFGNRSSSGQTITPATGTSRAAVPYIKISPAVALPGETVQFSASQSTDPDGSVSSMKVEWDFNGDGMFDTTPSTTKTVSRVISSAGTQFVAVRVTDASGVPTVSSAVVLHAHKPSIEAVSSDGNIPEIAWDTKCGFTYQLQDSSDLVNWSALALSYSAGDGSDFGYREVAPLAGSKFFKVSVQKNN